MAGSIPMHFRHNYPISLRTLFRDPGTEPEPSPYTGVPGLRSDRR